MLFDQSLTDAHVALAVAGQIFLVEILQQFALFDDGTQRLKSVDFLGGKRRQGHLFPRRGALIADGEQNRHRIQFWSFSHDNASPPSISSNPYASDPDGVWFRHRS